MIQSRPALPTGHGELVVRPAFDAWPALIERNRALMSSWDFHVAGISATRLRMTARREMLDAAQEFSARLGVHVRTLGDPAGPVVMTGHQPELYHPGVWVKNFLLQRIAEVSGASAVDVVVDSDGFDAVSITAPCLTPDVRRCRQYLAVGTAETCYGCAPVPDERAIDDFCRVGDGLLSTLPAPSLGRHFAEFCAALRSSRVRARNLAELVTFARRDYEASAGTDYAEIPVTGLVRSQAYAAFIADIALNADRFASAYNDELDEYRSVNRTRSAAQPFPNLAIECGSIELPLWAIGGGARRTVSASLRGSEVALLAGDDVVARLPLGDPEAAIAAVRASEAIIAPKALVLTLYARLFCSDLFIHGVGGGRYDRVTDGVCRRYYGAEPPAFTVASLTMYLPLGAHVVTEDEVSAARERLNRMEHNPDAALGEVDFDTAEEREQVMKLAAEKRELVSAIATPGADKKTLGLRIREVNAALGELMAPVKACYERELESLEAQLAASEVFTDRTYPFCLWAPDEIADKVR